MAEPQDYILPKRKANLSMGFVVSGTGTVIRLFSGYSKLPTVDRVSRTAQFHFEDETENLANYKLSGGSLQLDIRTDRYIWGILDNFYENYFLVLASCDVEETWVGGADETTNHRGGTGAIKIQSTSGSEANAYEALSLDASGYSATDYIDLFVYVEDIDLLESAKIRISSTTGTNYVEYEAISVLVGGWNELHILRSDFVETGTIDWETLDRITLYVKAIAGENVYCIFDEVRLVDEDNYPRRQFDVGLQTISVAWWAGNTALYEIQTACEAESAIFYANEEGVLCFENRQHYNLSTVHKTSQWGFDFNKMTDLEFPSIESDIINKVIVRLKPRKIAETQNIWTYGFYPSIVAGGSRTIWASLDNPCPITETGIVEPVETTDFTANTQADGLGTDKTTLVSIVTTKFANAVKMVVTNNDAGAVYLTLLKLRGTPALESDEVTITVEDSESIGIYGEKPSGGLEVVNKYLADESYADTMAQSLVDKFKNPTSRILLKSRAVPQLQLGDMITVNDSLTDRNYLMRITWMKTRLSIGGGMEQEIHCRMVVPQETLSYFQIGYSLIESADVIAP
jgi:hypothetical protein